MDENRTQQRKKTRQKRRGEMLKIVQKLIKMKYSVNPIHRILHCTYPQLELAIYLVMNDLNYEEFKTRVI